MKCTGRPHHCESTSQYKQIRFELFLVGVVNFGFFLKQWKDLLKCIRHCILPVQSLHFILECNLRFFIFNSIVQTLQKISACAKAIQKKQRYRINLEQPQYLKTPLEQLRAKLMISYQCLTGNLLLRSLRSSGVFCRCWHSSAKHYSLWSFEEYIGSVTI